MMRFAKKRGQIGGQGIDKMLGFGAMLLQIVQIQLKTMQAKHTDPACQSAVHHRIFTVRQPDPRQLM